MVTPRVWTPRSLPSHSRSEDATSCLHPVELARNAQTLGRHQHLPRVRSWGRWVETVRPYFLPPRRTVSVTVVAGRRPASRAGTNCPVRASRTTLPVSLPAIGSTFLEARGLRYRSMIPFSTSV